VHAEVTLDAPNGAPVAPRVPLGHCAQDVAPVWALNRPCAHSKHVPPVPPHGAPLLVLLHCPAGHAATALPQWERGASVQCACVSAAVPHKIMHTIRHGDAMRRVGRVCFMVHCIIARAQWNP